MFTLGNKEAIVNSSAKYPVSIVGTKMSIQGYGNFEQSQVVSAEAQRFEPSRLEEMELTAPSSAELGIDPAAVNVPVTFGIRVSTFRDQSEWATDFIKNGRPIVFEILVSGGLNSLQVAEIMVAAFAEWQAKFNYSNNGLPFGWAITPLAVIRLVLKDHTLMFQEYVEFQVNREIYTIQPVTTKFIDTGATGAAAAGAPGEFDITLSAAVPGLAVGDTIEMGVSAVVTAISLAGTVVTVKDPAPAVLVDGPVFLKTTAKDPIFDGKYLEENVRMSLASTSDSYGISPDEKPMISGKYTTITFVMKDDPTGGIDAQYAKHKFLGVTRGELGGERQFKFTLYILEGTDMFADSTAPVPGKVWNITDFLGSIPTPVELKLGSGEIVATADEFVNA